MPPATWPKSGQRATGRHVLRFWVSSETGKSWTAVAVTYDAVQLHGGLGYMRETWVGRLSRDARLLPIGGGTRSAGDDPGLVPVLGRSGVSGES